MSRELLFSKEFQKLIFFYARATILEYTQALTVLPFIRFSSLIVLMTFKNYNFISYYYMTIKADQLLVLLVRREKVIEIIILISRKNQTTT